MSSPPPIAFNPRFSATPVPLFITSCTMFSGTPVYQNSSGTPYTINGAVEDGVFLLFGPLSVGEHVIHSTVAFSGDFSETWTRHLIVLPVALTGSANSQSENL